MASIRVIDPMAAGKNENAPSEKCSKFKRWDPWLDIAVLDCGAWPDKNGRRTFGVVSGSDAACGEVIPSVRGGNPDPLGKVDSLKIRSTKMRDFFYGMRGQGWLVQMLEHASLRDAQGEASEDVLCGAGELYLFIPDTHICLGPEDPWDAFARVGYPGFSYYRSRGWLLTAFLYMARQLGAKTVQTGDMFDVWAAEVAHGIYHRIEVVTHAPGDWMRQCDNWFDKLTGRCTVETESTNSYHCSLRSRSDRTQVACRGIEEETGRHRNAYLDWLDHFVPGNHDWECHMAEGARLRALLRNAKIHKGAWHPEGCHFTVSHGHIIDSEQVEDKAVNITDPANACEPSRMNDVDGIMCNVPGKAITYWAARDKRTGFTCEDSPEDPEYEKYLSKIGQQAGASMGEVARAMTSESVLRHMAFGNAEAQVFATLGQAASGVMTYGIDAYNYNRVRRRVLEYVRSHLAVKDGSNTYELVQETDVLADLRQRKRKITYVRSWSGQQIKSDIRAIVHSHTHMAQVSVVRVEREREGD